MSSEAARALELVGVTRRFGAVVANDSVDFVAAAGEIHALVGENGAGKSTLMHVAFGLVRADAGEIRIAGKLAPTSYTPQIAMRRRVGMVHQHFMLVEDMTVCENVMLGREATRRGRLDFAAAAAEIAALGGELGLAVDPEALVGDLSVGEKQRVEILKALIRGCDVLILDEPTAVLTPSEVAGLFEVLAKLAAKAMAIVLITHKLDEVFRVAERITVMRGGRVVASVAAADSDPAEVAELMVGRQVAFDVERGEAAPGEAILAVRDLSVARRRGTLALDGVSLTVRAGEVVGVAGVEGNGQRELVAAIGGLIAVRSGAIEIGGHEVTWLDVAARRRLGLSLVPEDRQASGLILDFSVEENLILGRTHEFSRRLLLDRAAIASFADKRISESDIRPAARQARARSLSGGNQQKIVIARELGRPSNRLLVASQPTRGVDIGAIERIHAEIIRARDAGLAVLLLSAEIGELRTLSDRLLVLCRGKITGELSAAELAEDGAPARVGRLMLGVDSKTGAGR